MFLFYIGLSDTSLEDNEDIVGDIWVSLAPIDPAQISLFNNKTGQTTLTPVKYGGKKRKKEIINYKLSAGGSLHDLP